MNNKIFQTALVIFLWAIFAFTMSVVYYWLKDLGIIWDNNGNFDTSPTWNSRKVIIGIVSFSSFILAIVKVSII